MVLSYKNIIKKVLNFSKKVLIYEAVKTI